MPLRPGPLRVALLALAGLPACALPPSDVHLAPLYSHHSLAVGGSTNELFGGIVEARAERRGYEPPASIVAVRPLFWLKNQGVLTRCDILYPFGFFKFDDEESLERFFPLWWWVRRENDYGEKEVDWALFPILYGGTGQPQGSYFAIFPLGGTLKDHLSYDRIDFVLFPLFGHTLRNPGNEESFAILFPFVGWGHGDNGWDWWRLWPIYGQSNFDGHYQRKFFLWPFWHSSVNDLDTASPMEEWMLWPFYGQREQGAQHGRSIFWPFFSWEWNDESGYSTVDAPWPIVRVIRNGSGTPYEQTRVWPFYGHYRGEEIDSKLYLWPIFWDRTETTPDFRRDSLIILPFLYLEWIERKVESRPAAEQPWRRESVDMLFPLYRANHNWDGSSSSDVIWPLPWPKVEGFRENWLPYFSLFTTESDAHGAHSARAFLDLFRLESNDLETRWSLPLLGGCRSASDGTVEWSLLAGLLRWSSGPAGSKLLLPAFPGPGFPPFPEKTDER